MEKYIVIFITCPSHAEATNVAEQLVNNQLAACVNIVDGIDSVFRWQGKIEHDKEFLLIVKSKAALLDTLILAVHETHSYDVPEIIALPIIGGSSDYLSWLNAETLDI